jgi:hypothetical protein
LHFPLLLLIKLIYSKLMNELLAAQEDVDKTDKGNNTAARRVSKVLQATITDAQNIRIGLLQK